MHEEGEKSRKLFLNLERKKVIQWPIRKLIIGNQEITDQNKIQMSFNFFTEIFSNLTVQNHMVVRSF